jgi:hypothetical protein
LGYRIENLTPNRQPKGRHAHEAKIVAALLEDRLCFGGDAGQRRGQRGG